MVLALNSPVRLQLLPLVPPPTTIKLPTFRLTSLLTSLVGRFVALKLLTTTAVLLATRSSILATSPLVPPTTARFHSRFRKNYQNIPANDVSTILFLKALPPEHLPHMVTLSFSRPGGEKQFTDSFKVPSLLLLLLALKAPQLIRLILSKLQSPSKFYLTTSLLLRLLLPGTLQWSKVSRPTPFRPPSPMPLLRASTIELQFPLGSVMCAVLKLFALV